MNPFLGIDPTEIKTDFSYDISSDGEVTIIKGDQIIKLTYWECILLDRILKNNS